MDSRFEQNQRIELARKVFLGGTTWPNLLKSNPVFSAEVSQKELILGYQHHALPVPVARSPTPLLFDVIFVFVAEEILYKARFECLRILLTPTHISVLCA